MLFRSENLSKNNSISFIRTCSNSCIKNWLFNIGAQGQLISAALAAALAGIYITNLPPVLHVFVALLCGSLVGALWAAIAGLLKAYRGVHEVISTIMLNSIAIGILDYLVSNPFKEPEQSLQRTKKIVESAMLPNFGFIPLGFILEIGRAHV